MLPLVISLNNILRACHITRSVCLPKTWFCIGNLHLRQSIFQRKLTCCAAWRWKNSEFHFIWCYGNLETSDVVAQSEICCPIWNGYAPLPAPTAARWLTGSLLALLASQLSDKFAIAKSLSEKAVSSDFPSCERCFFKRISVHWLHR